MSLNHIEIQKSPSRCRLGDFYCLELINLPLIILDELIELDVAVPAGLSYEFKNGITLDLRGAAAITKLNKNCNNVKWYNDGGMLTIGYKFELK